MIAVPVPSQPTKILTRSLEHRQAFYDRYYLLEDVLLHARPDSGLLDTRDEESPSFEINRLKFQITVTIIY